MKKIHWLTVILTLSSLAAGYGVIVQHRHLVNLRLEREQLVAPLEGGGVDMGPAPGVSTTDSGVQSSSSELLRLRSEVNQLAERKRALAGISNEHSRLLAEISSRQTNGYIRKREARLVGYETPEATVQSFLWALQNHDLTNLLQALTPTLAEQMGFLRPEKPTEELFKEMEVLPGMRIVSKRLLADDLVELQVEMTPDTPAQPMRFRQVDGHWKMSSEP
jgi:hypothetical protein